MRGIGDLERRYRGIWIAVLAAGAFFVAEVAVRVNWFEVPLRETLVSFEDNYLRWIVLTLVVILGVVINERSREAAITQQILDTLRHEIATPLALIYTQLELLSIRAPGMRQEDLDKVAGVQQAVMRIATLVRELSEGRKEAPPAELPPGPSPS